MNKFLFAVAAVVAAFPLFAAPKPDAEAKKLLQKFAEKGKNFRPASGRTAFFARGQLKYGLERNDYLHRWVDRPLFQDSTLRQSDTGSFIHDEAWKTMHHVVTDLYKLDGFAFFPMTKGREDLYRVAAKKGFQLFVLPEMVSPKYKIKIDWTNYYTLVENALKSQQSYRINGKLLLTTYPGDSDPAYWQEFKKKMTEKFGDKILIVPMHQLPTQIITGTGKLTAKNVQFLADTIRKWLRCVDGYYYNYPPLDEYRRYDDAFDKEVMLPLLTGILAEDEFKGKLLAWGTKVGHENFYAKGTFTYNCGGTSMLRGSVGSAVAARADVVNLVEWDEQNENTSFRPTLYNSFSTQRIMRYFSGLAKGKLFPRQNGDDAAVPNLILSYRKILVAGETLEFEIVNVPEAESTGKVYDIQFAVKDLNGKVVKKFSGKMADSKLEALRFNLKVADCLDHHLLIPELTVDGKVFASGFTPVELRANWNADNKWVKQPLRDVSPCQAEIKITGITPEGMVKLQGKVSSQVPLHSVDVVDSGDHIYQHNANAILESDEQAVFSILTGGYAYKNLRIKGEIKVVNASSVKCITQKNGKISGCITGTSGWKFPGKRTIPGTMNSVIMQLAVSKKDLDKAFLEVDLTGIIPAKPEFQIFKGKLPLADIIKKQIFAASDRVGGHFIIRHTDIQQIMPAPLNTNTAEFSLMVNPALPQSVYFIEVVDKDRKTFRSMPVTIFKPAGKKSTFSSFDFFDKRRIEVNCDANMLTIQQFSISPELGAAVKNSGGNRLCGMLGGNSSWVNNFYFAESYGHGNLAFKYMSKSIPDNMKGAPEAVKENDGTYAWQFNGKNNVSFPQATIYPYSGFELHLNFNADDVQKRQTLITNSDQAFALFINKGRIYATFYAMGKAGRRPVIVPGPVLKAKQNIECVVRFDQKTAQIICNNVKGKAVPLAGYALYPAETSIGHGVSNFGFTGKISKVELRPL